MNCKYLKLISRYADNELTIEKKGFMDRHILTCSLCAHELKTIASLQEGILKNKVGTHAEFFWQTLKRNIAREEQSVYTKEIFALDFGKWAKRLIPVPIIASIITIFVLLHSTQHNLVDEYLFANQESSVLELIENAGNQSDIRTLLYPVRKTPLNGVYNKAPSLRSRFVC